MTDPRVTRLCAPAQVSPQLSPLCCVVNIMITNICCKGQPVFANSRASRCCADGIRRPPFHGVCRHSATCKIAALRPMSSRAAVLYPPWSGEDSGVLHSSCSSTCAVPVLLPGVTPCGTQTTTSVFCRVLLSLSAPLIFLYSRSSVDRASKEHPTPEA
jgi:hypothetical protein